jgi:hypothetical protein
MKRPDIFTILVTALLVIVVAWICFVTNFVL